MEKSPDAFRTISEVAELLETPAHVLRFWESRFPQIRPVKRAGGRRYYRPADVALLTGIKRLLHDDGMTIRGVQKILREQGVKHVSGVAEDVGGDDDAALEAALAALGKETPEVTPLPQAEVESAQIIALETALRPAAPPDPAPVESVGEDQTPLVDETVLTAAYAQEEAGDVEANGAEDGPEDGPEDAHIDAEEDAREELGADETGGTSVVESAPTTSAPVDLFSALTPAAPPPAPAPPSDPVVEAPMTLWAEEDDPEAAPQAEITAFPTAAADADEADTPLYPAEVAEAAPMPETPGAESTAPVAPTAPEGKIPSATLAARLRALDRTVLGASERETFGHLRMAARDLRQRLQSPVRPGS